VSFLKNELNNYIMEDSESDYTDDDIKQLLIDSLKMKLKDTRSKPNRVKINQAIISSLGEFLTCFKLIGYDIDGNCVNLTITKTAMDKSALEQSFIKEFGKFMSDMD
jgi:hypothetical protein